MWDVSTYTHISAENAPGDRKDRRMFQGMFQKCFFGVENICAICYDK